jgi:hypothetical protein
MIKCHIKTRKRVAMQANANIKKLITILCALMLIAFLAYKPYDQLIRGDNLIKELFILYSYIINTTLGWVHEGGHGVCYILHCPEFLTALSGTIFQLGVPLILGLMALGAGGRFWFFVALFFVGFSSEYTAFYISTAHEGLHVRAENSFLGVDGFHDFYTVLSTFGVVGLDWLISAVVKMAGYVLMIYACFKMALSAWGEEP